MWSYEWTTIQHGRCSCRKRFGCYRVNPDAHHLQNQHSQKAERKGAFNQNAGNLGWLQHLPKTTSEDSARCERFPRGIGKSSQLMRGPDSSPSPLCAGLCAGLLIPCNVHLDVILLTVWSHNLLGRLLKGKLGKKSSHLLTTYFSFLCPWSYRKNRQVRQGIVRLKDLKCALGQKRGECGGAWFKSWLQYSSEKVTGKGAPRQSWFPTKSFL